MKALVTGAHGTVGSRLCDFLQRQGVEVVRWDRARVPVDDYWAMEHFVRSVAPDVLFHRRRPRVPPSVRTTPGASTTSGRASWRGSAGRWACASSSPAR
ncbi:NAD-dependent epimerase/dehydratase family protein [Cystobacter fuscus]